MPSSRVYQIITKGFTMELYIITALLTFTLLALLSYLYSRFVTNKLQYKLMDLKRRTARYKRDTALNNRIKQAELDLDAAEQAFFESL